MGSRCPSSLLRNSKHRPIHRRSRDIIISNRILSRPRIRRRAMRSLIHNRRHIRIRRRSSLKAIGIRAIGIRMRHSGEA